MIGVGIIFPFMNIIINNNIIIYENKYLYLIFNYFGFDKITFDINYLSKFKIDKL